MCGATGFSEKRLRRSKRTPDDSSDTGIVFNVEDRLRIQTYFPILDALMNDLNRRIEAYSSTENRFALRDSSESQSLRKLTNFYSVDLDPFETVTEEWNQWRSFVNQLRLNKDANADKCRTIRNDGHPEGERLCELLS